MLTRLDEHPLHQITQPFSAVATQRPAVERRALRLRRRPGRAGGADVERAAVPEQRRARRVRLHPPRRSPAQHPRVAASCARTWITTAPARCASSWSSRCRWCASCWRTTSTASPATCGATAPWRRTRIRSRSTRVDGRLLSERLTYELVGECSGWVSVDGSRIELDRATTSFFRNHSWGAQAGRGGPRPYGAPTRSRRVPGVRQWVLFHLPSHGGFYFEDPNGREASGKGAILRPDGLDPVSSASSTSSSSTTVAGGCAGGAFALDRRRRRRAHVRGRGPRLGVLPGRRLLRRLRRRARAGRVPRRVPRGGRGVGRQPPDHARAGDGESFEFANDWAESFTKVTSDGEVGLAHFECVVIRMIDGRCARRARARDVQAIQNLLFAYAKYTDAGCRSRAGRTVHRRRHLERRRARLRLGDRTRTRSPRWSPPTTTRRSR